MTLFAGIVAYSRWAGAIPPSLVHPWVAQLEGREGERVELDAGAGYAVVSVDTGIYGGGARRVGEHALSWLAGDPLLGERGPADGRGRDFDRLHASWAAGDLGLLRSTRGAFCGVHLDTRERRLWLVADKLGLRPLYYAMSDGYACFATSMRLLLACPVIPRDGDPEGLAQVVTFGAALGERTALDAVRCLTPATIVDLRPERCEGRNYWRWDRIRAANAADDEICTVIRASFDRAVRARVESPREAVALLSGGLDSRCVVACLRETGVQVHSIGFGPRGTADEVLARQVADALSTRHFAYCGEVPEFWSRLVAAHGAWTEQAGVTLAAPVARQVWTGEGGDRVLAPVNLTEDVIAAMRVGDPDRAIAVYLALERTGFPGRLIRRRFRRHVVAMPAAALRGLIARYGAAEEGRRFHLFILLDEARRNIRPHFEDFDRHRIELVMPFYDSDFVATVLGYPVDRFIRHRLYNRLMTFMPPAATSVPWQSYPGSEPCPLPLPPGVRTQWETWHTPGQLRALRRATRANAAAVLRADPFPGWLINRGVLRVARLLSRFGVRRYDHLFGSALPFVTYPPRRDALRSPR